jgi:hypothetical protein
MTAAEFHQLQLEQQEYEEWIQTDDFINFINDLILKAICEE